MKITTEDFKNWTAWEKFILDPKNCPKLPKGCTRPTLLLYCFAMASHGRRGQGCFAGDATIGREIGIANRNVVTKYRHLALDLGWFARSGEKHNRVESLNIAIPSTEQVVPLPDQPTTHDELPAVRGGCEHHRKSVRSDGDYLETYCDGCGEVLSRERDPWAPDVDDAA